MYRRRRGCSISDGFHVPQISEEEGWWLRKFKKEEIKSIARHIRLADVLLAMEGTGQKTKTADRLINLHDNCWGQDVRWNLRADDIEKQSEETISFLYELLR
jgi:hypothetical protein